jgi:hypothetical protein
MPRGDKTGPMGMGPMTGRRAGLCRGNAVPGYVSSGGGRPFGMGGGFFGFRGRGRGFRNMFYATGLPRWLRFPLSGTYPQTETNYSKEDEIRNLKARAEHLNGSLAAINKRLGEIENNKEASE